MVYIREGDSLMVLVLDFATASGRSWEEHKALKEL